MSPFVITFFEIILPVLIGIFGLRTMLWQGKSWQLREYRTDRMGAWLRTADGKKSIKNLWFFKGIAPRPKMTSRAKMFIIFTLLLSVCAFFVIRHFFPSFPLWVSVLITERLIWLSSLIAVKLTGIIKFFREKSIFKEAKLIRKNAQSLRVIGITGSYGKSTTKEILGHLAQESFGHARVLITPENTNSELGVANFIIKNKAFFEGNNGSGKRYFIAEMGAYRVGEIKKMCEFVLPDLGIITAIGTQHIELFGSQKNIIKAKIELARASDLTFYPALDNHLSVYFGGANAPAGFSVAPLASRFITTAFDTKFSWKGEDFKLPWGGEFFAHNAHLALNLLHHLGVSPSELKTSLASLPPMDRSLKSLKSSKGVLFLEDLYSANPTGVMAAIKHLSSVKGRKIMVCLPLREQGKQAKQTHREIFNFMKQNNVELFWLYDDFAEMGAEILGENFHRADLRKYKKNLKKLKEGDGVLLESRLPEKWVEITRKILEIKTTKND